MRDRLPLPRRCLDSFWVATWRDLARVALRDARSALTGADFDLEVAAYYASRVHPYTDDVRAAAKFDAAIREIERARRLRADAKAFARTALTGEMPIVSPERFKRTEGES